MPRYEEENDDIADGMVDYEDPNDDANASEKVDTEIDMNEDLNDYEEDVVESTEVEEVNFNPLASICVNRDTLPMLLNEAKRTSQWMTKYEYTKIKGTRLEELAAGACPYVNVPLHTHHEDIFDMEFKAGALPYILVRRVGLTSNDYCRVSDLKYHDINE